MAVSDNPSITPLSLPTKLQSTESPATKPRWTARRCNHLLRPLTSRLADLRKAKNEPVHVTGQARTRIHVGPSVTKDGVPSAISPSQVWSTSPRQPKRIKRTYSTREGWAGLQRSVECSDAGESEKEASFQNPGNTSIFGGFLKGNLLDFKASVRYGSSSAGIIRGKRLRDSIYFNKKTFAQDFLPTWYRTKNPQRWKIIDGILRAVIALLTTTSTPEKARKTGSRSLFSTCLKRTYDYIAVEQRLVNEENPDNIIDISTTVYNELEAFGSSEAGGWTPLREVVRAHGIAILGNAVKDGLLDTVVARGLVQLCIHFGAVDEGQHITECLISMLQPIKKPASSHSRLYANPGFGIIANFADMSKRYGFEYRQMTKLLNEGIVPIEWMATTDMNHCLDRLMLSLCDSQENTEDAEQLLRMVLFMSFQVPYKSLPCRIQNIRLCARNIPAISRDQAPFPDKTCNVTLSARSTRLPDQASETEDMNRAVRMTSSELLALLSAINCLQIPASSNAGRLHLPVLRDIILEVRQAFEVHRKDASPNGTPSFVPDVDLICLPLLAATLIYANVREDQMDLDRSSYLKFDVFKHWKPSPEFANTAATFLCSVINHYGQASFNDPFHYMQKVAYGLTRSSTIPYDVPETRELLGRVAATAAIKWTKETNIPKHLTWALDLEFSINGMSMEANRQTPTKSSYHHRFATKKGFKWEDGICEWVAGTPAVPILENALTQEQDQTDAVVDENKQIFGWKKVIPQPTICISSSPLAKLTIQKQQEQMITILSQKKSGIMTNRILSKKAARVPVTPATSPAAFVETEGDETLNDDSDEVSKILDIPKTKAAGQQQQNKILPVASLPKPTSCLVQVSSSSLNVVNGIFKSPEPSLPSFEKLAGSEFYRVEIEKSSRTISRKVPASAKTSPITAKTHYVEVTPPKFSDMVIDTPSKDPLAGHVSRLDMKSSHTEAENTRRRSQRYTSSKRKASPGLSADQQKMELARIKRQKQLIELAESEDELSFA